MSLAELLPSVRELSRLDKLRLIQVLAAELAETEDSISLKPGETYAVWSPHDAHEAAAAILDALKAERTTLS